MYNNELKHFGVKGQKWGVRRYQNEDGSYTSAGKKRYGKLSEEQYKKADETIKKLKEASDSMYDHRSDMYKIEREFRKKHPNATPEQINDFYDSDEFENAVQRNVNMKRDQALLQRDYVKSRTSSAATTRLILSALGTAAVGSLAGRELFEGGETAAKRAMIAIGSSIVGGAAYTISGAVKANRKAKKEQQDAYKRYGIID